MSVIQKYIDLDDIAAGRGIDAVTESELPEALRRASAALTAVHSRMAALPKRKRGTGPDNEVLLTIKEAAKILGVHFKTLHDWIGKGRFHGEHGLTRVGRGLRVRRSVLIAAAAEGKLRLGG